MVWVPLKPVVTKQIRYSSYESFNDVDFLKDITLVPFHVINVFDDYDDQCWIFSELFLHLVNEHTPVKIKEGKPV